MLWYSTEYNGTYARGGFESETQASIMVCGYSSFLITCVCLCMAANQFYVSTLSRRLRRKNARDAKGYGDATTAAVSDAGVSTAETEAHEL